MKYVDGFVLVVQKRKLKAYRALAQQAGKIWKKHGALDYVECVGDDLNPDTGGQPILTFPKVMKPKSGETVVFSFITYRSKAHRDKVNAQVMKDPAMSEEKWKDKSMPFDVKRMAWGGFNVIVKK